MTKAKLLSKAVRARSLAVYELDQLISYIRTIDSDLQPHQAIVLTAFVLADLPNLFKQNPELVDRIKEIAANIKQKNTRN
ncbi:hypothetical protein [Nostoc sp. DSM 114167]|jgi:hypothetical protein|uniref:hypothetical protein n=1 Tax=Nostoc sp. DSM 114167 TaxID=3439050 RepID=UPI0040457A09